MCPRVEPLRQIDYIVMLKGKVLGTQAYMP
jgi:hypothetical protein